MIADHDRKGWLVITMDEKDIKWPRNILQSKDVETEGKCIRLGRFHCVFNKAQDAELLHRILHIKTCMYGLITRDVRCLAYQVADKNGIKHPFLKSKQAAGQYWFTAFEKRHPKLTIKSPEATSVARTGRKQVACITSAEESSFCPSVKESFVPALIIFKLKRMKEELKDGAPPGSILACIDSEWMKDENLSAEHCNAPSSERRRCTPEHLELTPKFRSRTPEPRLNTAQSCLDPSAPYRDGPSKTI
ncbi:hypothetical protein ILUMI_23266 [Ignelater luminosus]|uniref:HTH CENPB-type domain-containing protein n=1 Tax=Ignelater luminosus TaxID=2038154 RepID=A0A8K0FZS7_IGNLU|nr:hypothetical protein ILUMI_23266 [Ignelater luminosus]